MFTEKVPDIGADAAEVVEVCVAVGDRVEVETSLIVLETDKASMEVPSTVAGVIKSISVSEGDQVTMGAVIAEIETAEEGTVAPATNEEAPTESEPEAPAEETNTVAATETTNSFIDVVVPDIGDADSVELVEVCVAEGDSVSEGDSIVVLETDKASVEVPAPADGVITTLYAREGSAVKSGERIAQLQTSGSSAAQPTPPASKPAADKPSPAAAPASAPTATQSSAVASTQAIPPNMGGEIYAGPAVRKLSRQLGVDLSKVKATGVRSRLTKEDVRNYVKEIIQKGGSGGVGIDVGEVPAVDFSQFGKIEKVKMSKIKKATAKNMHRSWLHVPHVTQFDEADIDAMESYRKGLKAEAEKRGAKMTPLPFLIRAAALTLKAEPSFNVSMDKDGEHMIQKHYVHVGIAVDTPIGLMVPVIRDVDQKDIWQVAEELGVLAGKARDGKLSPKDMQGGCFTLSSLGAIGGTGFTPIVNTPEVGIMGVSNAAIKPFWDGDSFVPRKFLPLSLSYDHRAVNGADAGRFLTHFVSLLAKPEEL